MTMVADLPAAPPEFSHFAFQGFPDGLGAVSWILIVEIPRFS